MAQRIVSRIPAMVTAVALVGTLTALASAPAAGASTATTMGPVATQSQAAHVQTSTETQMFNAPSSVRNQITPAIHRSLPQIIYVHLGIHHCPFGAGGNHGRKSFTLVVVKDGCGDTVKAYMVCLTYKPNVRIGTPVRRVINHLSQWGESYVKCNKSGIPYYNAEIKAFGFIARAQSGHGFKWYGPFLLRGSHK